MTCFRAEGDDFSHFDKVIYHQQIDNVIKPIVLQFDSILKSYFLFNFLFVFIGLGEVLCLILLFHTLIQSSLFAIGVAFPLVTLFTYFILRVYYRTKKPEQYRAVVGKFLESCKETINYQEGVLDHHLMLSDACCLLVESLKGREYSYFKAPRWLSMVQPLMEKASCWWSLADLFVIKEQLLQAAVQEHIRLVKAEPTNLDAHAGLATAYVILSGLYVDPRKGGSEDRWLPKDVYHVEIEKKFRQTAEKAIEEFKILSDYAPNEPWVHEQLALSYHDLKMPDNEIREYEIVLKLNPEKKDILYKLGVLYFEQGRNAAGLEIYEELKRVNYMKAETLIAFYGS